MMLDGPGIAENAGGGIAESSGGVECRRCNEMSLEEQAYMCGGTLHRIMSSTGGITSHMSKMMVILTEATERQNTNRQCSTNRTE